VTADAGADVGHLLGRAFSEENAVVPLLAVGRDGPRVALLARHSVLVDQRGVGLVVTVGETAGAVLESGRSWLLVMHAEGYAVVELVVERTATEDGDVLVWSRPGTVTSRRSPDARLLPPSFVAGEELAVRERWSAQAARLRGFAARGVAG
jgi:hypothetical protein